MKRQRIGEDWNEWAKMVLPPECGEIQRMETHRAFYAGALAVFARLTSEVSDGPDPQPQDLQMMEDLNAEFKDFQDRVKAGTA